MVIATKPREAKQEDVQKIKADSEEKQPKKVNGGGKKKYPNPTPRLSVSQQALKRLKLVAIAYSHIERDFFATEEAYLAEKEVEDRAEEVLRVMEKIGIPGRLYAGDEYFLTRLVVDRPDLVLNLVDTLRGKDALQTSVPGALEMVGIPYTGADMRGLMIGNDRNLFKQILQTNNIPTPPFQFIRRAGTKVRDDIGTPLIVKLNEGGGSVGIDNNAVKETVEDAQKQVDDLIGQYHMPVVVEKFIDGFEVTAVVFDDGRQRHIFMGQKVFGIRPDGKHEFTSRESYNHLNAYQYVPVQDPDLVKKLEHFLSRCFSLLHNRDYVKYDIRVDGSTGTPYFTDCNPNTAFGPDPGLPFTEVLDTLYGVKFEKVLASLLSKYARKIKTNS